MDDPETRYTGDNQDSNLFNQGTAEAGGVKASSGWDEKDDYIRKEETEEEEPETDQKEGEYEIPPPE